MLYSCYKDYILLYSLNTVLIIVLICLELCLASISTLLVFLLRWMKYEYTAAKWNGAFYSIFMTMCTHYTCMILVFLLVC